ncbi:MAG: PQQ-binding-like beta-propeller repeat protein [Gemmataceae bacterium]|nr:PQQ-binding-like beta-propeller repeat protein [Gemmataceae bacterium]
MHCHPVARWLLILGALLSLGAVGARAENWPQWRGPNSDGISRETNLPAEFGASKNLVWKLPLPGMGGATPIIWGEKIFLSSEDGEELVLLCLSTEGKQLWRTKLGASKKRFFRDEGNQASASPSTDGKHVYVFFGTGDFACCDFQGKVVWQFNAQERYGKFDIQHGMHVTPVLHGDRLYVSLLHAGGWWVIALDKATGREVWKAQRPTDGDFEGQHSYASPVVWSNGKEEYLVVHGCDYTTAHRLTDGSEVWRLGDLNLKSRYDNTLRFVASPAVTAELIIVPTAKHGPVVAVKSAAKGKVVTGSPFEQWRLPPGKGEVLSRTPDVPCPLVRDGLVYLCRQWQRETGALICLEARTGKEVYYEKLHAARYRASPVYADGKIYLTARDGTITVVKAGPRFQVLAVNRLPDEITASPVVSNGRIYVRGFKALYAFSQGGK